MRIMKISPPPTTPGHHPRLRQRINGAIPEILNFGAVKTHKTPKQNAVAQINAGKVNKQVKERWEKCTGFLVHTVPAKDGSEPRRRCVSCGKKTAFYCVGCCSFFCFRSLKGNPQTYCIHTKEKDGSRTNRFFEKSCFHEKHKKAYAGSTASL